MSCAKPSPRTKSFYIVDSGAELSMRLGNNLGSSQVQPAKIIPAVVSWFALATLAQFISDVAGTIAELVVEGLSWLLSEFLAGCAAYAEAMHPMQLAAARPESPADQAMAAPAAIRPRLIVVSDSRRDTLGHDLPKQVAATGSIAVRDRILKEAEMIRSAGAPAARRKNRPR
jgi:hypothetical protein